MAGARVLSCGEERGCPNQTLNPALHDPVCDWECSPPKNCVESVLTLFELKPFFSVDLLLWFEKVHFGVVWARELLHSSVLILFNEETCSRKLDQKFHHGHLASPRDR